jgi:hypothetical protein
MHNRHIHIALMNARFEELRRDAAKVRCHRFIDERGECRNRTFGPRSATSPSAEAAVGKPRLRTQA